jgi:hypothetical protein
LLQIDRPLRHQPILGFGGMQRLGE